MEEDGINYLRGPFDVGQAQGMRRHCALALLHSGGRAAQLGNGEVLLREALFLLPVMILMAFGAAAIGGVVHRAALLMAGATGGDPGQQHIRGLAAVLRLGVTALALDHAMRVMIEVGVLHPAYRDGGFGGDRDAAFYLVHLVAKSAA